MTALAENSYHEHIRVREKIVDPAFNGFCLHSKNLLQEILFFE
ncbi:hypothetical protein [Pradoshia sp.]